MTRGGRVGVCKARRGVSDISMWVLQISARCIISMVSVTADFILYFIQLYIPYKLIIQYFS